jgi:hypothetical protein
MNIERFVEHLVPATVVAFLAVCGAAAQQAPVKERPIPQIVKKDGRYALMVDGAPFLGRAGP